MKILFSIFVLGIFKFSTESDIKLEKIYNPVSICKFEVINTPKNSDKVIIINYKKKCDSSSNFWKDYSLKCSTWILNKTKILQIIRSRKKIDKYEFSYFHEVLPCIYSGYNK